MAERSKFQEGVIRRYYEHFDTISVQRLSTIVSEIYLAEANKPVKLWEKAKTLLSRVAAEDPRVAEIVAKKDIQGLARLVNELAAGVKERKTSTPTRAPHDNAGPGPAVPSGAPSSAAAPAPVPPPSASADPLEPENLKRAMKAFRKRLKLTRLDDESRLGRAGSPMTGGKKSQVAAIMPPREFPKHVWEELTRQGKLKTSDGVFYALNEN